MTERNLTQKDLAELSGITQPAVCRYVAGTQMPRTSEFFRIAEALEISPNALWYSADYTEVQAVTENPQETAAARELAELKHSLRVVFRAMSEPE